MDSKLRIWPNRWQHLYYIVDWCFLSLSLSHSLRLVINHHKFRHTRFMAIIDFLIKSQQQQITQSAPAKRISQNVSNVSHRHKFHTVSEQCTKPSSVIRTPILFNDSFPAALSFTLTQMMLCISLFVYVCRTMCVGVCCVSKMLAMYGFRLVSNFHHCLPHCKIAPTHPV